MLQCALGNALPRTIQLLKGTAPLCGRSLFAAIAARSYGRALPLRPVPILQPAASSLTISLALHTSSQRQKRRAKPEESLLRIRIRSNWQEIKKTPKPALALALAGVIPFVTSPLLLPYLHNPDLPMLMVLHGACVLAFIGGVRWGYSLPDNNPTRLVWGNLMAGALSPYLALFALLIREEVDTAMMALGIGFGISLVLDILGFKDLDIVPISPLWYNWLKGGVTVIAIASFIVTLFWFDMSETNQNARKELARATWCK